MTIICDSREQKWDHVKEAFEREGVKWLRSKLPCGDYSRLDNMTLVIDRKASLNEVESNLIHDHDRFRRECELARNNGIRLTVLVESAGAERLEDVQTWQNPRRTRWEYLDRQHANGRMLTTKCSAKPPVNGATLFKIMLSMAENYGIQWQFCRHQDAGKAIIAMLTGDANEPIRTDNTRTHTDAGGRRQVWIAG